MSAYAPISVPAETGDTEKLISGRRQILVLLVLAVVGRAVYWNQRPPDMKIFLEPWMDHIVHYGPINAFAHPFSNYEPAYLYLLALGSLAHGFLNTMTIVKILSIAGTLFLTFALADLLKAAGAEARTALLLLLLPSVVINDALLGQCDALWAGATIYGLAAIMRGQTFRAMVWCGVGIAFKAQAAFMAPVIIGAMIGRRAPLWQWAVPAIVFVATLVPPWLLGWPAMKLLTVYHGQATLDQICGRLGNPWMIFTIFAEQAGRNLFLVGYAAAGASAAAIVALAARGYRDPRLLILLAALSGTALPFFLPKMLERYYFLGDIMTLALALSLKNRQATIAVLAVQMASVLSHLTYLYSYDHPYPALGGAACAAIGLVAMCHLLKPNLDSMLVAVRSRWLDRGARRAASAELLR
jgi:Gpi18-like mannosyltransferase